MWPFRKRKRFLILQVSTGVYYAGYNDGSHHVWTPVKIHAQRFTKEDADNLVVALIIEKIGGRSLSVGPLVRVEE